jgi:fucose permease
MLKIRVNIRDAADRAPARLGLILAFYAFIAIGMAEGGLGVLLPSIMQTFHLTPAAV